MSPWNSTIVPCNERNCNLLVKIDMANVQAFASAEDIESRERRIVDEKISEGRAKASICDLAKVTSEQYNGDRERRAKQIVDLLHADKYELNEIRRHLMTIFHVFYSSVRPGMKS